MKKLLVTGGAGFIGSNFIRYWVENHPEDRVVNLDALTYAGNLENLKGVDDLPCFRFVHGDICYALKVGKLFDEEEFDTVVNFAVESHVDRSILGPEAFIKTNVFGTFTLLEAAKNALASDTSCCRFLHIFTDEVYGSLGQNDSSFTENTPDAPNSPYSASKAASDHLVRAYHHTYGLPVLVTNCSNNYGPYQFPEKLIPLVILNALEDKPLPIYGDGKNIHDWLHVEDHCRGIDAVLSRVRIGVTNNIGGCNEWANIDIVRLICQWIDRLRPGERSKADLITFVKDRPGHDRRYAINAEKIMSELEWVPAYTFETGIEKTVGWYLDNLAWCKRVRGGECRKFIEKQYRQVVTAI